MEKKTKLTSGADEQTPSLAQYFSWINSTNEGSTEEQTLKNLEYFKWLRDTYGMQLDIYAWDAGNLDGARETYEHPDESPKLKAQYPNGYKPLADAAADIGCRLGVWAGADGFGNTPEEEQKRRELIVSLCRDLGFGLFKFDTVCGNLRPEKRKVFKEMIDECRRYVPGLIVLNHRNKLEEAEICATTFLLGGHETYSDIFQFNINPASHHRACALKRDLVPDMIRLTEDHGVCLSSCMDYFEDEMIIQAFARCLILAPEIYGNPWLLRDDEQVRLARIYNLHRKYRDILVNGATLPESYGKNAVTRGDGSTRLIVLNNHSWEKNSVTLSLSDEIGLEGEGKRFVVKALHPYEAYVGTYSYGDTVPVSVDAFRAALILVEEEEKFLAEDFVLTNCEYEVVYGKDAVPKKALIFRGNGEIGSIGNLPVADFAQTVDNTVKTPIKLGTLVDCDLPENAEQLYEAAAFMVDCDCFEAQARKRAGETSIPAVKNARDAFFNQKTYIYRGPEAAAMFDQNPDTYFDAQSKFVEVRLDGGCLRVDMGEEAYVSRVEIECFAINEPIFEIHAQSIPEAGSYSTDLASWKNSNLISQNVTNENATAPVVVKKVHNIIHVDGKRITAVYEIGGAMRYFRLPSPMDRIYSFRIFDKNGVEIIPTSPRANNMLAPATSKVMKLARSTEVTIPADADIGSYLAIGITGKHGIENVYCAAMCDGQPIGPNDRAVSYPINPWEGHTAFSDSGYTYYINVTPELLGKTITVYALFMEPCSTECDVWLCDNKNKSAIKEIEL